MTLNFITNFGLFESVAWYKEQLFVTKLRTGYLRVKHTPKAFVLVFSYFGLHVNTQNHNTNKQQQQLVQ